MTSVLEICRPSVRKNRFHNTGSRPEAQEPGPEKHDASLWGSKETWFQAYGCCAEQDVTRHICTLEAEQAHL
jgi:hypothetical protein